MKLETIIENHTNAVGGFTAVENIQAIQVTFHLVEPTFAANGVYSADRSGNMRVDIFIENLRVFSEGLNEAGGWQLPQDAEKSIPTTEAGTIALKNGIENQLFGLHELQARGHQVGLKGKETVNGTEYFVVKLAYQSGSTLWRYINPNSWLIERSREQKALHPDIDPTETMIETQFSDFRTVGDVLRSFHETQIDLETSQLLQTTTVQDVKINPALEQGFFDSP